MRNYSKYIIASIFILLFLCTRFAVFPQMYQQDEYKWALLVDPSSGQQLESDHPPLVGFLYRITGYIVGFEHLRVLPIAVSVVNIFLVYAVVRRMYGVRDSSFGRRAARATCGVLLISTYFLLASTQIDIDGALLPLTMLLAVYAFLRIDWTSMNKPTNRRWYVALFAAVVCGFLIKLSFILVLGALASEWYIVRKPNWKMIGKVVGWGAVALAVCAGVVWVLDAVTHAVNSTRFLTNVMKFGLFNFDVRNYSQVVFLTIKSFVIASPLLLVPLATILVFRERLKQHRIWLMYILYNVLFYFVIFDFTNRTIERYMMFLIIPSAIITGVFLAEKWPDERLSWSSWKSYDWKNWVLASLAPLTLLATLCLTYVALPLNPKGAYFQKIATFDFRFLIPVTGGSGPIGFYVPVLFVIVAFVVSILAIGIMKYTSSRRIREVTLMAFLMVCIVYCCVLNTEYVRGSLYGGVSTVAQRVMTYIVDTPRINNVVTYYDIGGYELHIAHKYKKRFYTDPMFAEVNVEKFAEHQGYYAVVDFPEIDRSSVYWKYLSSCGTVFETHDKQVGGYVFDCRLGDTSVFQKK